MADSLSNSNSVSRARRRFLVKTLGLGAAGLAAGGAAAWTKGQFDDAAAVNLSLADLQRQLDQTLAAKATLEGSYKGLESHAINLQIKLDDATSRTTQLATSLSTTQQEKADLETRLQAIQAELASAQERLGKTTELVGLFERLDGTGLDALVAAGLASMSGVLGALATPSAALRGGLESARGLLGGFEAALPEFAGAMTWLGAQVVRLKAGLWSVESAAAQVVATAAAGFAAVFGGFIGFVIDHLPFDTGRKVRATLSATQGVLASAIDMTDNVTDQVLIKISTHVGDGPESWKTTLVAPLRDSTLGPAAEVLTKVAQAGVTYQASLKDPADTVLAQRQALRDQIAAFRANHGV